MPTYEYKREDGSTFEVTQGINDDPLEKCPETGQKVKRVITGGGGVVYKGDGFYITDYKRKGENSNGSASNGATKSESKAETSTS
ncbi:zinc ribbon domain-containing protein [Aliifodinibius sp. S!AR15-10]|uniref:FmdB family zinc ribbon protein n=1 Tax=Aliifodinibius sp. S!AR15-10 TaxID=2950437 RepID=UPI002864A8D7|nr:FmdB family zinc ribbon protein [Aliifodinibius sp. S!AR15-10]MDR8394184.1 zinc ribbon domain-containing protein [Aliifodinibius sp. S!AR15-10]